VDAQALIELIQTHLPEELTRGQIRDIRAKLARSGELQEALLEELALEQSLAIKYAPAAMDFNAMMSRIGALSTQRRKDWLVVLFMGVVALVWVFGTVAALVNLERQGPGAAPVAAGSGGIAVAGPERTPPARRPRTGPATKATTTKPRAVKPAAPTTLPAVAVAPPRPPITWQDYALHGPTRAFARGGNLKKFFRRRKGKDAVLAGGRRFCQLDGTYSLGFLPGPGSMLRFGVWQGRACDLEFWDRNNKGVRIRLEPQSSRIRGEVLARVRAGGKPIVIDSFDDQGAWRWYRLGAVDIRYQGGHILVCRGEIPLLRLPMIRPPSEGVLTAAHAQLWLADQRPCGPLKLPVEKIDETTITETPADKLAWDKAPNDKATLSIEADGAVVLSAENDNDIGRGSFAVETTDLVGLEATLHVRECTPLAGVYARVAGLHIIVRVDSHKGERVLGWGDRKLMADDVLAGRTVGEEFWVRIRFGLGVAAVWVSPDGQRWWPRRHHPVSGRPGRFEIGLEIHQGKGPRRIVMGDVRIRRFEAIRRLVDPDVGMVAWGRSALSPVVLNVTTRSQALAILDKARPSEMVDEAEWRKACDVNLVSHSLHQNVRYEALRALLVARCRQGADTDVEAVLAAVRELLEIANPEATMLPALLRDVFDALGRSCLEAGDIRALETVMGAGYLRPGSCGLPRAESSPVVPQRLLRMRLLDLVSRRQWKSVRLEAMRAMFYAAGKDRQSQFRLAGWATTEAQSRLGEESDSGHVPAKAAWAHPLITYGDRNMLNMMGEFLALVRQKEYESACRTITDGTLPDALVSLEGEGDILRSGHSRVRQIIRTTDELRETLKRHHTQVGMIRLQRARKHGDLAALRSLAVQFYGTAPGFAASHALADRDLANGSFYSAAVRYRLLKDEQDHAGRRDASVKFRLASAMLGELAGEPAEEPVVLGGRTLSAQEFERMVRRLAGEHKSASQVRAADADAPAPGPKGTRARLIRLAELSGKTTPPHFLQNRPTAFAVDGDCVIVNHADRLLAVDRRSRRVLWSYEPEHSHRDNLYAHGRLPGAVALVRAGSGLYVRCGLKGRPLTCFETKTGKRLWGRTYDDRVLSDPILIGSWLFVITVGYDLSGGLYLRRISPATGESSLSSQLVRIRDSSPAIGRPVVVGRSILFRTAGCLVNCNALGEVRWARRLPYVPLEAMPEVHTGMGVEDILVRRQKKAVWMAPWYPYVTCMATWEVRKVIFTAPGCPYVMCVDADSGELLWSFMADSKARAVALVGGIAIVTEPEGIVALDADTGKVRWRYGCSPEMLGILAAEKDTIMLVSLKKPVSGGPTPLLGRHVRWLSPADGRVIRQVPIEGETDVFGVGGLFSDGKRLFGVSGIDPQKERRAFLFEVEISG